MPPFIDLLSESDADAASVASSWTVPSSPVSPSRSTSPSLPCPALVSGPSSATEDEDEDNEDGVSLLPFTPSKTKRGYNRVVDEDEDKEDENEDENEHEVSLPFTPSKTKRGYNRVVDEEDKKEDDDDENEDDEPFTPSRTKRGYNRVVDEDDVGEKDEDENEDDEDDGIDYDDDGNDYDDDYGVDDVDEDYDEDDEDDKDYGDACRPDGSLLTVELPASTLLCPRSLAANYEPPLPVTHEASAVTALLALSERHRPACSSRKQYIELDQFEIYFDSHRSRDRLRSLHTLGPGSSTFYFDGILRVGGTTTITQFYVQRVPFSAAPVGHYGTHHDTVRGHVCIRSVLNRNRPVYYRLGAPSPAYARFYDPYLWVADLGKHFVDYAHRVGSGLRIAHFRVSFSKWLARTHPQSAAVQAWRQRFRPGHNAVVIDFSPAVVAYKAYLLRETKAVLGIDAAAKLRFFHEVSSTYYPTHPPRVPAGHPPGAPLPTVVTPYVYHAFRGFAVQKYMVATPGRHAPEELGNATLLPQGQTPFVTGRAHDDDETLQDRLRHIQPGDVLSTMPDGQATGSKWTMDFGDDGGGDGNGNGNGNGNDKRWYALVHRIIEPGDGPDGGNHDTQRTFDVAWLYAPQHTPCRQTKYPWANELFLSDHCTCEEDGCFIQEDEIAGVHSVAWFGGPETAADFFIRQTFLHGERSWIQLKLGHVFCQRSTAEALSIGWFRERYEPSSSSSSSSPIGQFETPVNYEVGDTVLAVLSKGQTRAEPCIVEGTDGPIRLRVLLRRHELDDADAAPNELVYTDRIVDSAVQILGRCIVRIFAATETIPTPYDRNGTGNAFYMTHRLAVDDPATVVVPIGSAHPPFKQGFDPAAPVPRLRALELFCGCGNLGRGIEDAGVTQTRCANDIWPVAMHTFMANVSSDDDVEPFIGSADTLLRYAIRGVRVAKVKTTATTTATASIKTSTTIPAPGEIDFISGGSPCQGFSRLTTDKATPQHFKNRSMVASFASYVDLYRPKYGILENVVAMAEAASSKAGPAAVTEDIFSQLVCALLGIGYQLRIVLGNAWFHGAPQKRQRVFVVFAAPGLPLPDVPLPSHGPATQLMGGEHTDGSYKAIGNLDGGDWITTVLAPPAAAFPLVSSGAATADLDKVGIDDGQVGICVPFPDHRVTVGVSDGLRSRIAQIPTRPFGMGLAEARHLRGFARSCFTDTALAAPNHSKAYKRVDPRRLFRTVRTRCVLADAWGPGDLHWRELRPLTLMEMRRAQGMPDGDLLLYDAASDPWKMVGNAVARQMALALGLALRAAYLGGLYEGAAGSDVQHNVSSPTDNGIHTSKRQRRPGSPDDDDTAKRARSDDGPRPVLVIDLDDRDVVDLTMD